MVMLVAGARVEYNRTTLRVEKEFGSDEFVRAEFDL